MTNIMVDLETLGKTADCVVLTLGAVKFDPCGDDRVKETRKNEKLYLKFIIETQQDQGRIIDDSTVKWWSEQDPEALEEAMGDDTNRIEYKEGLEKFSKFFWGCKYIWSHGALFDVNILEHSYRQYKIPQPWNYPDVRDTRTIFNLGHDPEMPTGGLHHALADSMRQVIGIQNVYRKLGIKL